MKKLGKLILCLLMCITVMLSCAAMSFAASVGKVKNLAVSEVSAVSVTLKWKKLSGVTGYRIYRYSSSKEKYVYIGKTKKLKYTDSSLSSGKTYKYKVRAYKTKNGKNTYGSYTSAVKAITKPRKVSNLKATSVTSDSVKLSWSKAKGATGYRIYVYDSAKGKYVSDGTTKSTKYTLDTLKSGTKHKIKVAAYHTKGGTTYGTKSNALTVTTKLGTVSSMSVENITANSYTLVWKAVIGATKYQIRRYDSVNKQWVNVATVPTNNYTVKNLTSGAVGKYQIRALNSSATGAYSATLTAVTLAKAPTNLKATTDGKTVTITWTPNGNSTGYQIERYNASNGSWKAVGTSVNPTFTDTTLKESTTCTYRVKGYTQTGGKAYYTEYSSTVSVFFESTIESGSIYSQTMAANGVLGYLYDPVENCFYTAGDPWQRNFGYNSLYDTFAPMALIDFDTARLRFEYKNKDWMIQLWKGQYGAVFYGAEIGVYNKPKDRTVMHYDCVTDDDLLKMSMDLYEYKNRLFGEDGWVKQFSRPYGSYWWCTGFVPGNKFGNYSSLRIDARITAKDYEMLYGIITALAENSIQYTLSGLNIYFTYY